MCMKFKGPEDNEMIMYRSEKLAKFRSIMIEIIKTNSQQARATLSFSGLSFYKNRRQTTSLLPQ